MKLWWVVGSAVLVLGFLLLLDLARARRDSAQYLDYENWPPSPAEVLRQIGPAPVPQKTENEADSRHTEFADLFKNRFRRHDPEVAVGMRFQSDGHIKLMVPARMYPWDIDRVAFMAWREAKTDFGHPYDIDIFETFIGMRPIQIGSLRIARDRPDFVRIAYHYPSQNRVHHPDEE